MNGKRFTVGLWLIIAISLCAFVVPTRRDVRVTGIAPIEPVNDSWSGNWTVYTFVMEIPVSAFPSNLSSATEVRVTIRSGDTEPTDLRSVYISAQAASGDAYDSASDLTQFLYSGGTDPGTIPSNSTVTSDWLSYDPDETVPLLIAFEVDNSSTLDAMSYGTNTGFTSYTKSGAFQAGTQNRTTFATQNNLCRGITLIEFR